LLDIGDLCLRTRTNIGTFRPLLHAKRPAARDWHHLIELCGMAGAIVIDPDGIYDPGIINDRLLLGLKGTMSEFELNLLRQRSLEAIRQRPVAVSCSFFFRSACAGTRTARSPLQLVLSGHKKGREPPLTGHPCTIKRRR
jgi:hypothetical protein